MPPIFRNADKVQLLPERTWLRYYMPEPKDGFVAEDGDLILDLFGSLIGREYDADGRLMLIQVKYNTAQMGYAQKRVYQLMHRLMRTADPEKQHYRGCYLVHWYSKEVTLDGRTFNLSNDSDIQELEEYFQYDPDSVDRAQWWIDHEKKQIGRVRINNQRRPLTLDEFRLFLLGEQDIPSLFDG